MSAPFDIHEFEDPGVRAELRVNRLRRRETRFRYGGCLLAGIIGLVAPFVAQPLTGDPGSVVGATLGGLVLIGLAAAEWPFEWSAAEAQYRRLDAIWHETRVVDADAEVPWNRYCAWVEPESNTLALQLICRAPAGIDTKSNPYTVGNVTRVDPADIDASVEAYERFRQEASLKELEARERYQQAEQSKAEKRAADERSRHEQRVADMQLAIDREAQIREELDRAEVAQAKAVEEAALADAVARALRRT